MSVKSDQLLGIVYVVQRSAEAGRIMCRYPPSCTTASAQAAVTGTANAGATTGTHGVGVSVPIPHGAHADAPHGAPFGVTSPFITSPFGTD